MGIETRIANFIYLQHINYHIPPKQENYFTFTNTIQMKITCPKMHPVEDILKILKYIL